MKTAARHRQHPCFYSAAKGRYGRIHLPVAPACNIDCFYCLRDHECLHENRPGSMRAGDLLYRLVRWGIGGIFLYAGAGKLLDPEVFGVLIDAYGIVPETLLMPVAICLPLLEVMLGLGLLADIRGSLSGITGLLLLFAVILGYGIFLGLDVDCGCFGPEDPEAEAFHGLRIALYRDLAMFLGILFLYGWRRYRKIELKKISQVLPRKLTKRRKEDVYA